MSKKLAVLMAIICIGLIAFVAWTRIGADRTGPEIKCGNEDLIYHDGMTHEELLAGVTAFDEKDGDVTDSLAVESANPIENGQVVVVYVAKDKSNNVTKIKQFYSYDAEASVNTGSEDTQDTEEDNTGLDNDGDSDADLPDEPSSVTEPSDTPDADGVTAGDSSASGTESSEAEELRKEQEAAAEQMPAGSPRIYLTDYLVKVPVGTAVDRLSYVKEITDDSDNVYDLWTKIQITGTLDPLTAGTYECTYYVVDSQGNTSNQAVLRFIVE